MRVVDFYLDDNQTIILVSAKFQFSVEQRQDILLSFKVSSELFGLDLDITESVCKNKDIYNKLIGKITEEKERQASLPPDDISEYKKSRDF